MYLLATVVTLFLSESCSGTIFQDEVLEMFASLRGEVSRLRSDVERLQTAIEILKDENTMLKAEVEKKNDKGIRQGLVGGGSLVVSQLPPPARLVKLESSVSVGNEGNHTAIGFYATRQGSVSLGVHQTIEFEIVHENVGNGYDKHRGYFVAPENGLYFLSSTIYSGNHNEIKCELVKNGVRLANMYAPAQGYTSATMSTVAQLKAGDAVWVRHSSSTTQQLNANNYSSFVGFRVA